MKILLTGATGYIGKRLLPVLVANGHEVYCCVRDVNRFNPPEALKSKIKVIEIDFLDISTLDQIPKDIDGAYYLIHSMSSETNYQALEQLSASNFRCVLDTTSVKHVVYLGGIANDDNLSEHLSSRKTVEHELGKGKYHFTTLRAGIIIGSGSASFEIIRDLVEKLPIMITPVWLNTQSQPIGVKDVIAFLQKTMFNEKTYDQNFDIGGPKVMTYKEMLLGYAKARGLWRKILVVPVMTPKLSSYWLYFITSTSFKLASALVNSMKIKVVCRNHELNQLLDINPDTYENSLERAFDAIIDGHMISSWKDSLISGVMDHRLSSFLEVPTYGCFKDSRKMRMTAKHETIDKIWKIGGNKGWYYATFLWKIRGFIDKLYGGVGLRRGRSNDHTILPGDAIDFWRVLYANKSEGRLLLYAEMKLPGDAWLEFRIKGSELLQTATFRPKGLAGRLYWLSVYPFHGFIFKGMLSKLALG